MVSYLLNWCDYLGAYPQRYGVKQANGKMMELGLYELNYKDSLRVWLGPKQVRLMVPPSGRLSSLA